MSHASTFAPQGPGVACPPGIALSHQHVRPVEAIDRPESTTHDRQLPIKVAVLETNADRLQHDMNELKTEFREFRKEMRADIMAMRTHDFRLIFGAIITLAVGMAALVAKGFQWI